MRNEIYYSLKPILPRAVRMYLRRWHARRILRFCQKRWPIDERAKTRPEGWQGWPLEKEFAVVLTHDVEGPEGLDRVKSLAEIEIAAGFRSAFNFIPEGTYTVPPELRHWLHQNGFEVGVHDLHHDGHLYSSESSFARCASKINQYISQWKAVGFRSGFMRRNLLWIHKLEIQYDSSTFDTDPFEPQPDGAGTIFPFWIPNPETNPMGGSGRSISRDVVSQGTDNGKCGYVELPYTLPQDSTLFIILEQPDISIWRNKVDWLVQNQGMVLVNVHPDYIRFENDPPRKYSFPIARYQELLSLIRDRYTGRYWHALPRDVAALVHPRITR